MEKTIIKLLIWIIVFLVFLFIRITILESKTNNIDNNVNKYCLENNL